MLQLEVVNPTGRKVLKIEADPFTIGRSSENHLQLAEAEVSRKHAELVKEGGGWRIRDLGSRFGVWVNETKVSDTPIKPGDRIRIGHSELRLVDETSTGSSSGQFDFRHMTALLTGLRALGSSRVLEEVLAIVLDSTLDITGAERGFILMADDEGKLKLTLARGRGAVTLTGAQTSRRIPDEVFATGVDQIVTDLADDLHAAKHGATIALGIRHVLCTPLTVIQYDQGTVRRIGVLYLDSRERGYLRNASALHALAAEAAVVIENARLYREVVEKERAAQELKVAAGIQQALLPPSYHVCGTVELAASMTPCRAVGGDFFDYIDKPNGDFAFAVGDVAGKGTSAALLTAVVQGLVAAEAGTSDDPGTVLHRINRALCRRAIESRFVTAFYGERGPGGPLRYCNAGHNAPFFLSRRGVERLETGGCILGVFEDQEFATGEVEVSSDDLVVVFSDGVTEALNTQGEEFGDDRLAACLDGVRTRPTKEVLEAVQKDLVAFRGAAPPHDDVTVMAVRFR